MQRGAKGTKGSSLDFRDIHSFQCLNCPMPVGGQFGGHDLGQSVIPAAGGSMVFSLADRHFQSVRHTKTHKIYAAVAAIKILSPGIMVHTFVADARAEGSVATES